MGFGSYLTKPTAVRFLKTGEEVDFEYNDNRIILKNLPENSPDDILGTAVIVLEFDEDPKFISMGKYPQLHGGKSYF